MRSFPFKYGQHNQRSALGLMIDRYLTLAIDPRKFLSPCPRSVPHTTWPFKQSGCTVKLQPNQGGSLYHFYDGLWYDMARAWTRNLPHETNTLSNKSTRRCRALGLIIWTAWGDMSLTCSMTSQCDSTLVIWEVLTGIRSGSGPRGTYILWYTYFT